MRRSFHRPDTHCGLPGSGYARRGRTAAVIQAAVAARGVAPARKALVAQELDSGRLVHLLPDIRWPVKWAYYIVAPPKALRRYEVAAFHDWLASRLR
ncbi:LysR substrate-binding domain-containing protein [Rhizobium leguminosarum]|uniref:LysR substrate-binding domain-containing protein n=1 Tax=Rhizobium leguminosarum TaxID=384 RepID=UPI001D9EF045|nr:LysR substrate-binding domain-containing protein [Rhizobium leguminosarum]MBP2445810.1 DNA-binding transcriptional LysR family regulator [Rhizobium leguminosarum]